MMTTMLHIIAFLSLGAQVQARPATALPPATTDNEIVGTWTGSNTYELPDGSVITCNVDMLSGDEPFIADPDPEPVDDLEPPLLQKRALHFQTPPAFGGSGPYRRVLTKPGFAYEEIHVTIPADIDISRKPTDPQNPGYNDTPYIYLGGWGANRSSIDNAIDAGLIFDHTTRSWSPFVARSKRHDWRSWPMHLKPGAHVKLAFAATTFGPGGGSWDTTDACAYCFLWVSIDAEEWQPYGDKPQIIKYIPISPQAGWTTLGVNQYLKRMTSIAQQPSEGPHDTYLKNVIWDRHEVFFMGWEDQLLSRPTVTSEMQTSYWVSTPSVIDGFYQCPRKKQGPWPSNVIDVSRIDGGDETVSIYSSGRPL